MSLISPLRGDILSHYQCMRCQTVFDHIEGSVAKCRGCGSTAVTQIEVTGRHG